MAAMKILQNLKEFKAAAILLGARRNFLFNCKGRCCIYRLNVTLLIRRDISFWKYVLQSSHLYSVLQVVVYETIFIDSEEKLVGRSASTANR